MIDNIYKILIEKFNPYIKSSEKLQPHEVLLTVEGLLSIATFLHDEFYFDSLSCITCVHNPESELPFEIHYQLYSIPNHLSLSLAIEVEKEAPSLTSIWETANWHEREIYDMFGVVFRGHPNLRRILLPNDWEGHPLKKDYKEGDTYHGITIRYVPPKNPE